MNVNLLKLVWGRMCGWIVGGLPKRTVERSQPPGGREKVLGHRPYLTPNFFSFCFLHTTSGFQSFHLPRGSLMGHELTTSHSSHAWRAHGLRIIAEGLESWLTLGLASDVSQITLALRKDGKWLKIRAKMSSFTSLVRSPQKMWKSSAFHSSRLGFSQVPNKCSLSTSLAFFPSCPYPGALGPPKPWGQGKGARSMDLVTGVQKCTGWVVEFLPTLLLVGGAQAHAKTWTGPLAG